MNAELMQELHVVLLDGGRSRMLAAADGREGRPRRYYRLTSAGAEMARAELRSRRLAWNKGHLLPLATSGEIR